MTSVTTVIDQPVYTAQAEQRPITSTNDGIPLQDIAVSEGNFEDFEQRSSAAANAAERWNNPRINTYRLAAIFFAFLNFGMNDGSYGALVPYVCPHVAHHLFRAHELED